MTNKKATYIKITDSKNFLTLSINLLTKSFLELSLLI